MSHKDGTMEFRLRKPVKVTVAGKLEDTDTLTFKEFDASHTRQYMRLKKIVDCAVLNAQKAAANMVGLDQDEPSIAGSRVEKFHEQSESDHAEEAEGIAQLLNVGMSVSDDEDIFLKFINAFREMIFKGNPICFVNDSKIGDGVWTDLDPQDKINAALRYCAFFGIGLLGNLREELETVSEQPTQVKEL